jgi:hypothetical protein
VFSTSGAFPVLDTAINGSAAVLTIAPVTDGHRLWDPPCLCLAARYFICGLLDGLGLLRAHHEEDISSKPEGAVIAMYDLAKMSETQVRLVAPCF